MEITIIEYTEVLNLTITDNCTTVSFQVSEIVEPLSLEINEHLGRDGKDFKYSDFTPEQLEALKGSPFTYEDFTPEQLELLRGKDFEYSDFTPEQLELLKGKDGKDFIFSDFTPEQLLLLKGDPFTYSDFTPAQLLALKGAAGKDFKYEDFTPTQLALLKGADGKSAYQIWIDAGNSGSVTVFLNSLKGAPGTSVQVLLATSQANAVALSTANPNNIYYWV